MADEDTKVKVKCFANISYLKNGNCLKSFLKLDGIINKYTGQDQSLLSIDSLLFLLLNKAMYVPQNQEHTKRKMKNIPSMSAFIIFGNKLLGLGCKILDEWSAIRKS